MLNILVLILFIALQVFDVYSTYTIIEDGGKELNKSMAKLMEMLGVRPALYIVKGLMSVGACLFYYISQGSLLFAGTVGAVSAFYIYIFSKYNWPSLKKVKK